ncbi:hypothetical protein HMSSN036_05890 [Paenibacillus macerans]|nr:hypothetical protein HMSSN036_05890 [Paenibacillus macerans]
MLQFAQRSLIQDHQIPLGRQPPQINAVLFGPFRDRCRDPGDQGRPLLVVHPLRRLVEIVQQDDAQRGAFVFVALAQHGQLRHIVDVNEPLRLINGKLVITIIHHRFRFRFSAVSFLLVPSPRLRQLQLRQELGERLTDDRISAIHPADEPVVPFHGPVLTVEH